MKKLSALHSEVNKLKNPKKALILGRFFKTGKGEYGHGDVFFGITVPQSRAIARQFKDLEASAIARLLKSKIHEERLIAILILVHNFSNGTEETRKHIVAQYLRSTKYINNWDLVDLSTDKILGKHLGNRPRGILRKLAKSRNLWERRIAVVATFNFIKHNSFNDTFIIADILRNDSHDLIHKAVGWMLREVGKRDRKALEKYLKTRYSRMPRTMLRYAIERFSVSQRRKYLLGHV